MKAGKTRVMRRLMSGIATSVVVMTLGATPSRAAANYMTGHIADVTFLADAVMLRLDSGQPDNCTGTAWGWIKVPVANKNMSALVLGLWLRGDAASTSITVYTDGVASDGYCRITQIDPAG